MKLISIYVLGLALALGGCVTKKAAEAQARSAYLAGRRDAVLSERQHPAQELVVQVRGDVQHPVLPWTPGLTLAKAILAAGYKGSSDPTTILIVRTGQAIQVDPSSLLNGHDVPLQPQDIIALTMGPGPISSGNTAPHTPSPSGR